MQALTMIMCNGIGVAFKYDRYLETAGFRYIRSILRELSLVKRPTITKKLWNSCEKVDFRSFYIPNTHLHTGSNSINEPKENHR
jgi:hypothetical protein